MLDLPGALAQGAPAITAAGLTERITALPGDLSTVDLGADHDLALLFNIVHGYPDTEVGALLKRVAAAVRPGGRVALLEPLAEVPQRPAGTADSFVRAFSLNLFHTQGGRAYSFTELSELLTAAGFTQVTQHLLRGSEADHLVLAVRAGDRGRCRDWPGRGPQAGPRRVGRHGSRVGGDLGGEEDLHLPGGRGGRLSRGAHPRPRP